MELFIVIGYISKLVWLIIPFRYLKSKHFYFFLFLGLHDVISYTLWMFFDLPVQTLTLLMNFLMLAGLEKQFFNRRIRLIVVFAIAIIYINQITTSHQQQVFVLFVHAIILFLFIRSLIRYYFDNNQIDIFYLIITLYELTNVLKLIILIKDVELGVPPLYATLLFQILIGLYLIIFRDRHNLIR